MKVNKKILSSIFAMGAILLVGCNNEKTTEISVDSTNESAIVEEADTKDLETSEAIKDEVVEEEVAKGITEDEALNIVYDNIKSSTPDIKLKIKSREFIGNDEVYIIEQDTPFATDVTFNVTVDGEKATVLDYSYYEDDISRYETSLKNITKSKPLSIDDAKSLYLKIEKNALSDKVLGLSENQINNLELAVDYMVKTPYNYSWVYKYPMEEKQQWLEEGEKTYANAKSIDDKYGYLFIDPYRKQFTGNISSEAWGNMEFAMNM